MDGQHISVLYDWYCRGLLNVNRTYQRKLVWTADEKRSLIDTIFRGYPLPLFLLASKNPDDETSDKEVIDGLQRLEAIFAFIDNKYAIPFEGSKYYFNKDCVPGYGAMIRSGELEQKEPYLPLDMCRRFMQYQIPVSIVGSNTVNIEDVFKRINSTGRKLSTQNLRQAGVIGKFSRLVQDIASEIRGETLKDDIVPFKAMETISLGGRDLDYGVDVNKLFWIKNDIINEGAIRRAKDEEIIANIANYILAGKDIQMTATALDNLYDNESSAYELVEAKLADEGVYNVVEQIIIDTFGDIKKLLASVNMTFTKLTCSHKDTASKDIIFAVIFLALVELRQESYYIHDYKKAAAELSGIADTDFHALISDRNKRRDINYRNNLISGLKGRLRPHAKLLEHDIQLDYAVIDLLKRAKSESSYFDFKLTTWNYRKDTDNAKNVLKDCVLSLTAMANTHPNEEVRVIIGVADSEDDAEAFTAYHGIKCILCNSYYIAGVDSDAKRHYVSVTRFAEMLRQQIINIKEISDTVKNDILGAMCEMYFEDRTIYVLKYKTDEPVLWGKDCYVRRSDSNHKLTIEECCHLSKQFYKA